jgi:hypothetical protein
MATKVLGLSLPKTPSRIRMSLENLLWGTPGLHSDLRLLGFDLADETVAKYRVRASASPSQTWKTFLFIAKMEFSVRSGDENDRIRPEQRHRI